MSYHSVGINYGLYLRLKEIAKRKGLKISATIDRLVEAWLAEEEPLLGISPPVSSDERPS